MYYPLPHRPSSSVIPEGWTEGQHEGLVRIIGTRGAFQCARMLHGLMVCQCPKGRREIDVCSMLEI